MSDQVLDKVIPDIERMAEAKVAEHRLPGMAVGIVRGDGLAWWGGFGRSDLESGAKPDQHSIARVASVTKTFTTTAIMQLRDAGKLGLEDPLVQHIAEFSGVRAEADRVEGVTLRRLLTHRSGLVTESPVHGWAALRFPSREEILAALPDTGIVIPQDSAWKYSNLGFALLGEVVYRLTGQPCPEYVREHILDPLGLTSTAFDLTEEMKGRAFVGYNPTSFQDRPDKAPYAHLNGLSPAGQLHSTVHDLAEWVSFQFGPSDDGDGESGVLDARTLAEIQRPQYVEPDWSAGQCLGWRATRVGNRVYHSHGGGIHGFGTQVWFNVPSRTGAIVLINMWPPHGGLDLAQEMLERVLDAEDNAPAPPKRPTLEATPDPLKRFLGRYYAEPGIHVNIEYRDGQLRLEPCEGQSYSLHAPAVLEATDSEDEWMVRGGRGAGERAVFSFDAEGCVISYALGGFEFRRFEVVE